MTTPDIFVLGADAQAAGGYFQVADLDATAPTDATSPLVGFTSAGIISLDGVTVAETKSTTPVKDASGAIVRVILTEYGVRVSLSLLAPTLATFEYMYGVGNVTQDANGNITRRFRKAEAPVKSWALHFVDEGRKVRLYLPAGQIVETGDKVYNVENPTNYEVVIECRPNADGDYALEFTQGGETVVYTPGEDE